jgi:hypothetical protein
MEELIQLHSAEDGIINKMEQILDIVKSFNKISSEIEYFKPTLLYCEGWLLRLILFWFDRNKNINHKIKLFDNSTWYSEGSLPTFFQRKKGFQYSEGVTYCDAVYGNIELEPNSYKISLTDNCKQFVVIEAKMYSKFSSGTSNVKDDYDQASRIVCCMCNLLSSKNIDDLTNIAFYTIIPKVRPNDTNYEKHIDSFRESLQGEKITKAIEGRIKAYTVPHNKKSNTGWYNNTLIPFIEKLKIELLFWEDIIEFIEKHDKEYGNELNKFYEKCIGCNM